MTAASRHSVEFSIGLGHPSLAGHFPGRPVVPGVLILDRVAEALEAWLGPEIRVRGLPQVKFLSPLLPDQPARIELETRAGGARFRVHCEDRLVASGELSL